jgi:nucleotide-binding universal stress UspA family protein
MITLGNVLVATDFGEASESALAYGRELTRTFGARLHVLHVVDDVRARALGSEGHTVDLTEVQRAIEQSARERLDAIVHDDDRCELRANIVLRTSTATAMTIVSYAQEMKVDLIVMGTQGRGGLSHLLMGSVAERVVRTAPCPVLTVRHPEHEFIVPDALQAVARS